MKSILAVRQREKIDYRREVWIAIRRNEIDSCREAKKKIDYCREAWIAVRRNEIDSCREAKKKIDYRREAWIAIRRNEIDSCREVKKKSIIAVRRRKNWYRGDEKIDIAVIKKIDIAAMKKSISRQWKNQYRDDEKIDIAAMKKSISRGWKNRYRGDEKIRCCWEFTSNTWAPLKRRAKAETVSLRKLSTELSEALRDRRCGQKISFWWHHQGHGQTNPA